MSIYASIDGIDDDSPTGPPWRYQGSHILPAEDDPRDTSVGLAYIPAHITRDGRDDGPDADGARPWPWARLSVDTGDAVITPAQARHLAAQLTEWADWAEGGEKP